MSRQTPPIPALSRRAALVGAAQALALLASSCTQPRRAAAPGESPALISSTTPPVAPVAVATQDRACAAALPAVIPPTPIPYPGYTQQEPSTGLHVTAEPQIVELATYRLKVTGKVARELSLTYDELRCLPRIGAHVEIVCPGFFIDSSNLAGASLASVLALAGPLEGANRVNFTGVDGRLDGLALAEAQAADNFLAYEWEGELLPVSHGFPVRVALPGRSGGYWTKWLQEITVS